MGRRHPLCAHQRWRQAWSYLVKGRWQSGGDGGGSVDGGGVGGWEGADRKLRRRQ